MTRTFETPKGVLLVTFDIDSIQRLLAAVEAIEPQPAVLLITHDQELAGWADRAVWLEEGRAHRWRPMTRSE